MNQWRHLLAEATPGEAGKRKAGILFGAAEGSELGGIPGLVLISEQ